MDISIANRLNLALASDNPSWAFYRSLSPSDANEMDKLLISRHHPLAYEAGTQWSRFQQLHRQAYRF